MVFSHHQLLGRSQQIPWHHLWPILLKYSSFPGNNSQYDQNQISLPILMYYIWDLQPKNKGWHKKGEKRARRKRKIEEPSSGLIWQMQSRKRAVVPMGVENFFYYYYYISLNADLSDYRVWLDQAQPWARKICEICFLIIWNNQKTVRKKKERKKVCVADSRLQWGEHHLALI